jgi:poly(A) polymerase
MPSIYRVGGCVRDELMGLQSKDIDFTFVLDNLNLEVEEGFSFMENWLNYQGFQIFLSTPEMFTIRAKFPVGDKHEGVIADFVLARKEVGYLPGTRRPILKLGTLEDDLVRRDFTVNAMAISEEGELIDLFGGEMDIKRRLLKTPTDPNITLMEDPLRILRAIRFAITKNFLIDEDIWEAMKNPSILSKLKNSVSQERIREEVLKMMQKDTASTIKLLNELDEHNIPGILEMIFSRGLWLKPTFEKIKNS